MTEKVTRVDVPLRMIQSNIETMVDNAIPCNGVSFRWAEDAAIPTLVLIFHQDPEQRAKAEELGMKFAPIYAEEF